MFNSLFSMKRASLFFMVAIMCTFLVTSFTKPSFAGPSEDFWALEYPSIRSDLIAAEIARGRNPHPSYCSTGDCFTSGTPDPLTPYYYYPINGSPFWDEWWWWGGGFGGWWDGYPTQTWTTQNDAYDAYLNWRYGAEIAQLHADYVAGVTAGNASNSSTFGGGGGGLPGSSISTSSGAAVGAITPTATSCSQGMGGATASSSSNPSNTGAWTRDQRSIQFAQNCEGGEQFTLFLTDLYNDNILPSVQSMAAQLGVSIKEQTSAFAKMIDAQTQAKTQAMVQQLEQTGRLQLRPSENVCIAKTQNSALVRTEHVAAAISSGLQRETASREMNSVGSTTENGTAGDKNARWNDYENIFCNANANAGSPGCAADGTMPDTDISVEQFLLSDTIDQSTADAKIAVQAILRNLVEPSSLDPMQESTLNSATGREAYMTRRHLMAVRQIPVSVVSSIISRRTSIPGNPAALQTQAIRTEAGVPAADISAAPSYNETMLAMTKERFLHPEYFRDVSGHIEKVQQEQSSVDEYISIQLMDIYDLQEQINALIATRASLKFNKEPLNNDKSGNLAN